jgi:hypothetical protein
MLHMYKGRSTTPLSMAQGMPERFQGGRARELGEPPPGEGTAFCMHFRRGSCHHGDRCAFRHDGALHHGSDGEALAECEQQYRDAQACIYAMRARNAPRDELAAIGAELHQLQLRMRTLAGAASARLAVPHRQRRPKNGGRAGAFRQFLLNTYGEAVLGAGSGLLDVAGGGGTLSFELLNIHRIGVTVIDPRPTLRMRRHEKQFAFCNRADRTSAVASNEGTLMLEQGLTDAAASVESRSSARRRACGPRHPRHWRMYWRDEVWKPLVTDGNPASMSSVPSLATFAAVAEAVRTAPEQAESARRTRKQQRSKKQTGGGAYHEAISDDDHGNGGGDGDGDDDESASDLVNQSGDDAGAANVTKGVPWSPDSLNRSGSAPPVVVAPLPTAEETWATLRDCSAIVG